MIQEYYDQVRLDLAKEFGLEALGYGQPKPKLPIQVAQRIVAKYPGIPDPQAFRGLKLNPKAELIAQRYVAIFKNYL
jgi:hypothetical protein